jgi:hypothetical protein
MVPKHNSSPNPKRVAAGRRNRALRRGLTPEGRERLRAAALENEPWVHATGPRTAAGKAKAAANGQWRQAGALSRRQLQSRLAEAQLVLGDLAVLRRYLLDDGGISAQ